MGNKKKSGFGIDKIIVVAIGLIAVIILFAYLFPEMWEGDKGSLETKQILLEGSSEPSSINFNVPSTKSKIGEEGILEIYEQSEMDSIQRAKINKSGLGALDNLDPNPGGLVTPNRMLYEREEDSLAKSIKKQLQQMEMEQSRSRRAPSGSAISTQENPAIGGVLSEDDSLKRAMEYRNKLLLEEREYYELLKRSKEEMTGGTETEITANGSMEPFRASIYRDQFILPGDRVKLLLNEDVEYQGKIFKRNTIIYATANINRSRVLLDVTNINHVGVNLEIRDIDDGGVGLYNKRAGELWREFQGQVQQNATQDIGRDISQEVNVPLIGSALRAFNGFFRRKRYKEADKILLVNDHQVLISPKIN